MNIFMQGMRRSGTTIAFDILWEDGGFDCCYEPLAADRKPVLGGGSGVRWGVDYFEEIRRYRSEFMSQYQMPKDFDEFNYGAPRQPELEFEQDLPEYCQDYIRFIISNSENTVIKFTRMYCKVRALWDIDPHAKFIHIVRDPRSVTASYLLGKRQWKKQRFPDEHSFFSKKSDDTAWSSYSFSEFLLNTPEYAHLQNCRDFMRVLLLWKFTFQKTYQTARKLYGPNYFLLRHEDLMDDPEQTLAAVYKHLGRPVPSHVFQWALNHVQQKSNLFYPHSKHWRRAFQRLDMETELEQAGYTDCLKKNNPIIGFFGRTFSRLKD